MNAQTCCTTSAWTWMTKIVNAAGVAAATAAVASSNGHSSNHKLHLGMKSAVPAQLDGKTGPVSPFLVVMNKCYCGGNMLHVLLLPQEQHQLPLLLLLLLIKMQKTSLAAFLELLIESTRSVAIAAAALATKTKNQQWTTTIAVAAWMFVCLFVCCFNRCCAECCCRYCCSFRCGMSTQTYGHTPAYLFIYVRDSQRGFAILSAQFAKQKSEPKQSSYPFNGDAHPQVAWGNC